MVTESEIAYDDVLELYERYPTFKFRPKPPQKKWIRLVGSHTDDKPDTYVWSKPNKVGGTLACVVIIAEIIWGPTTSDFDFGLFKHWPYPKKFWIFSEDSTIKEVIAPMMKEWFPSALYTIDKMGKTWDYRWVCEGRQGKFEIIIKTYDIGEQKAESDLVGLVLFSEPPPYEFYKAIPARMPAGGIVMIDMTPVVKPGGRSLSWVYDELHDQKKCTIMYSDIEEVCIEHSEDGLWHHTYIEKLISKYDPDEREARARGVYAYLSGLVYKGLNERVHLIDDYPLPSAWQYHMIIDPHDRKAPAIVWAAIDPENNYTIVREYPEYNKERGYETLLDDKLTIEEHCKEIKKIESKLGRVTGRTMDPYFGGKQYSDTRKTIKEMYQEQGISCQLAPYMDLAYGHDRVKDMLEYELGEDGEIRVDSRLKVFRSCQNTWRFLSKYAYRSEKPSDHKDIPIQVEAKFKDYCDVVRYLCVRRPTFTFQEMKKTDIPWRERLKRAKLAYQSTDWRAC